MMKLPSLGALAVLCLISSLMPTATNALPARPSGSAHTQVIRIRPVDAQGHLLPGYTVTRTANHANCWTSSEAVGGAYRCTAGHFIYDPCWAGRPSSHAFCIRAGWTHKVLRLNVTKDYGRRGHFGRSTTPWGLRLLSGLRCGFAEGATGSVRGRRINFGCRHGIYLAGEPRTSRNIWRIRKVKQTKHYNFKPDGWVKIAKAWFGKPSLKG